MKTPAVVAHWIIHLFLFVLLTTVVAGWAPVSAQTTKDKTGFGGAVGGEARRAICPAHSVMSSVWTVVDNESLKSIQIECAPMSSTRILGANFAPSTRGFLFKRGFALSDDSVFQNLHKMPCAKDAFVTGFNPGVTSVSINGSDVQVPWHSWAVCRSLADGQVNEQSYALPSRADGTRRQLGYDGLGGPRSCAADEVGVGVWGRVSDDYVLTIGMVCAPLDQVRPLTAVERGADRVGQPATPKNTTVDRRRVP